MAIQEYPIVQEPRKIEEFPVEEVPIKEPNMGELRPLTNEELRKESRLWRSLFGKSAAEKEGQLEGGDKGVSILGTPIDLVKSMDVFASKDIGPPIPHTEAGINPITETALNTGADVINMLKTPYGLSGLGARKLMGKEAGALFQRGLGALFAGKAAADISEHGLKPDVRTLGNVSQLVLGGLGARGKQEPVPIEPPIKANVTPPNWPAIEAINAAPRKLLPAPRIRMPEASLSTLEEMTPKPTTKALPPPTTSAMPPSPLAPRTEGFRVPVEPFIERPIPASPEATPEGIQALQELVAKARELERPDATYKPPTVKTDLRQLEKVMKLNTVNTVEGWADSVIRDSLTKSSSNPFLDPEFAAAAVTKVAILMKRGIEKTPDLQKVLKDQFGRFAELHADDIIKQARELHESTKKVEPIKEGEPNASQVETPTTVYGDVRPQPGQGEGQVPIQKSSAGVQPQTEGGIPQTGVLARERPEIPVTPPEIPEIVTPLKGPPLPDFTELKGTPVAKWQKFKEQVLSNTGPQDAKNTAASIWNGLKAAKDKLINKFNGYNEIDELLKAKGVLSAALEKTGYQNNLWAKEALKAFPDKAERDAITAWVDTGGDRSLLQRAAAEVPEAKRARYINAQNLSPDALMAAHKIQKNFDARLQEAIDAGVLEHGVENYIHRIYERNPELAQRMQNYVQSGILSKNPALAKKRLFQFDFEAEKAGLSPVTDFIPRMIEYENSLARAIAAREFIKKAASMKAKDGRPILEVLGNGSVVDDSVIVKTSAMLGRNRVPRPDYVKRDYPALTNWKWITNDTYGNPVKMQGNLGIHPDYVSRFDVLLKPSAMREGSVGKVFVPVMQAGGAVKQTMLDISGFHQVQIAIHGLEHRVNPFQFKIPGLTNILKEIDFNDPRVDKLLQSGISLGGEFKYHGEGTIGRGLTKYIPGIGTMLETYHNWLFREFIPRTKITMALDALERNTKKYSKELKSGKYTMDDIYHLTAKEADAAFGEQNYITLERSKTAQDILRLILLAPDFLEARTRFALQAITRHGSEQRVALALGALTMWLFARIANKATTGQWHNEPENAFSLVNGNEAYSFRTVQSDIIHALTKPISFMLNRLNPVTTRPALELVARDQFGRKRTPLQVLGDTASNVIPISLRTSQERRLLESIMNAFGLNARRYMAVDRVFKLADDWKQKNGIQAKGEFIYDRDKDPLRGLKIALSENDEGRAAAEIKKLISNKVMTSQKLFEYFNRYAEMPFTGSVANDNKFKASLSEDDKQTFIAAKKYKQVIKNLFRKSYGQYYAALNSR